MSIRLPIQNSNDTYLVNPKKIIALGLNYHEHIQEADTLTVKNITKDIPSEPILFNKTPNVLIGHNEAIIIPAFLREYGFDQISVDYEAELAFIIKERCKNVPAHQAYQHILGFTCMNDVSQRNLQSNDKSGWFRGKSLDTFGPIGPKLVPEGVLGA